MASTITGLWNTTGGDWFNGANWNEPNNTVTGLPLLHYVPMGIDTGIQGGSSAATGYTITYNGTDAIDLLNSTGFVTMSMTGGSLEILGDPNAPNAGSYFGTFNQASGATLKLDIQQNFSAGSFSGTVTGSSLRFINGRFDINAGAVITTASWFLDYQVGSATNSNTYLNTDLTYGGDFELLSPFGDPSYLHLNNQTLTLSGTAVLASVIEGPGRLKLTGTALVGGATIGYDPVTLFAAANAGTLENAGSVSQNGSVGLNGTILNDAGATWTFTAASSVVNDGAIFTNNGTLADTATTGNGEIQGTFNNNAAIQVTAGATLVLSAGTEAVGGTVSGAGTLAFGFGHNATLTTTSLTVGTIYVNGGNGGGTLGLGENLIYGGIFNFTDQFGSLALNGDTLTLSGASSFVTGAVTGPGTVRITGTDTIGGVLVGYGPGGYTAGNAANFENAGSVTQNGGIGLNGAIKNDLGATWTINTASSIPSAGSGGSFTNDGTLADTATGGNAEIDGAFTNTGAVTVASGGSLLLAGGTQTLGGTVSGAGALAFGFAHNATLATTALTVATINVNGGNGGGTLRLGENLTYGGTFNFTDGFGSLALNGDTLTLSGTSQFTGGSVTGPGTVRITGTDTIGGVSVGYGPGGYTAANAATFENAGSVTQNGSIGLDGAIKNDLGATWTITAASGIPSAGSGGSFTNNGTLADTATGGNAEIDGAFTNTGAVSVVAGGTLLLAGGTQTLGGTVSGAGTLALGFAHNTTISTTALTVAAISINGGNGGGLVTLGEDLAYAGTFSLVDGFGSLNTNGHTLTLSGGSTFGSTIYGPGGVVVTGTSTINGLTIGYGPNGGYTAANAGSFTNASAVSQAGNVNVNGSVLNRAGASWTVTAASSITGVGPGGPFINNGSFSDAATGTSQIGTALTNAGTVTAGAGILQLRGTVTNNGTLAAAGGTLQVFAAVSASAGQVGSTTIGNGALAEFANSVAANQTVRFTAAKGTLQIDNAAGFAGTVAGFQVGDVIDIGIAFAAGEHANLTTGNLLQVTDASNTVLASLQLDPAASYAGKSFNLGTDAATGGTDITLGTAPSTLTIAASSANKPDGVAGVTPYTFTVTRTGDTSQAATATYSVAGSGATPAPGSLFVNPTGSVAFAAGSATASLSVNVGNASIQQPAGFTVTLTPPAGYSAGTATATGTIQPTDDFTAANKGVGLIASWASYVISLAGANAQTYSGTPLNTPPAGQQVQGVTAAAGGLTYSTNGGNGGIWTEPGGPGNTITTDGPQGSFIASGNGADTINSNAGNNWIATGVGATTINLNGGGSYVASEGADNIAAAAGSDTIEVSGNATIHGGAATLTVFSDAGSPTVTAGSASVTVYGAFGGGSFAGGSAGNNLLVAGTSASTIMGGGSGDVLLGSGGTSTVLIAASGNETLTGQFSSGNNVYTANAANALIVGGAGTNLFNVGSGNASIVGGTGTNTFVLTKGAVGGTDYIANFNVATDKLQLAGYGAGEAGSDLASARIAGGAQIVTLSDGTQLVFLNQTGITAAQFH